MPRIAFLYRTDTHVCDRNPASWKGDYPAEIWSNLEQIGRFARERDVTAVLDGGDYFHIKQAARNSHALIIKSAAIQNAYPCPTFTDVGNHDITYNNLESLDKQPLGVLYESRVFRPMKNEVFEDGGMRVRVVGMPYSIHRTLDELKAIQKQPGDDFLVAVVHQLAGESPPAKVEEFFNEPVFHYGDLVTPDGPDVWCFGHWHKDQGVVDLGGKRFVNLGAVSRGALSHENLNRTPKVCLIEAMPGNITVTPLELVVAPAADVFDFEKKARIEAQDTHIDEFLLRMHEEMKLDFTASVETVLSNIGEFEADVRTVANEYLERARAQAGVG